MFRWLSILGTNKLCVGNEYFVEGRLIQTNTIMLRCFVPAIKKKYFNRGLTNVMVNLLLNTQPLTPPTNEKSPIHFLS